MEINGTCDELLSPLDTACLHIEDRTSLVVNVGAMVFAERLDYGRVKETLEHRFLDFHRFRQRVVFPGWPPGLPHWEDDPSSISGRTCIAWPCRDRATIRSFRNCSPT
jgi:hypothetical protein